MDLLEVGAKLVKERTPFAMAIVINSKGSSPRSLGTKMIVLEDGTTYNTIGGGILEVEAVEESIKAIREGKSKTLYHRGNSDEKKLSKECSGTSVDVFIDVYIKKPHVIIVGGGHCGYALSKGIKLLGWNYSLVEERKEYNSRESFPEASNIYRTGNYNELENIETDNNTYIVIVNNDHSEGTLERIIMKKAVYIGMMGSSRKISGIMNKLIEKKIPQEKLDLVNTPIGLNIEAETPEEISFSILSEIIKIKRK